MRYAYRAVVCILFMPILASAQVVITEIMYDLRDGADGGREWIEVQNISSTAIDLTKWKIVESNRNHKITAVQGSFQAGTYAVVADNAAKFKIDHPEYAGVLFDSAFSLSNEGEVIALFDATGREIEAVAYDASMGGSGSGDSLQKIDTGFAPGLPTPGAGVPAGGLVLSPQPEQSAKKRSPGSKQETNMAQTSVIGGAPEPHAQVAMTIAPETQTPFVWPLGVVTIAGIGALGVFYARRARGREWEIEEIE